MSMDYFAPGMGGGSSLNMSFLCDFSSSFFFIENITGMLYNIQNSKLCFCDMKIMLLRNGGDLVNNLSGGLIVYRITTIPL